MLPTIRAGRSSRPIASFVRLAKHRAHRCQPTRTSPKQWRLYATNVAVKGKIPAEVDGALSGM